LTATTDTVSIQRLSLLQDSLPPFITSAFEDAEQSQHEAGLAWLRNLANTALPEGEAAYIFIAQKPPGEFVALPMRIDEKRREAHALTTYYSSIYSPACNTTDPAGLLTELFTYLARSQNLVSLTLSPMDPDSKLYTDCQLALAQSGWKGVHSWHCFTNWFHPVTSEDYPSYLQTRPSRLRNTIRRKQRKFYADDRGDIEVVTGVDSLMAARKAFESVYASSWKQPEPYPHFIPGLLETAASRGWLRLGIARYDGKPVAAQLWLVANGTAAIFKLAYHQDYRTLSPGTVLSDHLMAHVIEHDKVKCVDYLTGDDSYKKDWMSAQRERRGLAAYNPATLKGRAKLAAHTIKRKARTLIAGNR